jgi:YbbR domain-containing protein
MVKKAISITTDEAVIAQIRQLQAKITSSTGENWSFSEVTEILVTEGLRVFRMNDFKKKL